MAEVIYLTKEFDNKGKETGYYFETFDYDEADAAIIISEKGKAYNMAKFIQEELACCEAVKEWCNEQDEKVYYIYGLRDPNISTISSWKEPKIK